jgi:hypothetical protein
MRTVRLLALLTPLALPALASVAMAQDAPRYTMERAGDGFVRMDTVTGAMSTCTEGTNGLVCRMAVDDREAYAADIAALEDRVKALEDRLARLPGSALAPKAPEQSQEEFETAMERMEGFFRRFMGIVKEFQGEFGGTGEPPLGPDAQPDRT